ncbi:MAG: endolytic transglycosylase MltG [Oscillospiraceae bacterium]|nr:endolytic transglycosylase MltG [Oscillospiraceae bacterium]
MKEPNFPEEINDQELPEVEEILIEEVIFREFPEDGNLPVAEMISDEEVSVPAVYPDDSVYTVFDAPVSEEADIDAILSDEELLHEDLTDPDTREELMAADHAMYSAGLQHPEDAEFLYDTDLSEAESEEESAKPEADDGNEAAEKDSEEPVEEEEKPRPVRKGRPKRKDGPGLLGIPHLLSAAIWLLIIVAIGTTLGRMLWVCAADVLAFGREDKEVIISVTAEDTMDSIAQKLKEAGLVRYPKLFLLYADLTDAEEDITTGTFTLNTIYDYHALVNQMSPRSGARAVVEDVLIPEGYNCRQIFALLEEKGVCKAADLEKWAAEGDLKDYWFLEGVERGHKYCLEGFLFPDTYDFYENSTPKAALEKMLDGFEYRVNEQIRAQLPALNEHLTALMRKNGESEEFIAAHQFDMRDVIIVASLIEKETASNQESYRIASVIYNRLFNWGNNPRYLNIDATVIYALGGKTNLTSEDMAVDSPYNTYTNTGLTPGPIANPGLASIEAALNPESTSYYYYVLDPNTGVHQFSTTLEEHEKKIKQLYGG